MQESSDTDFNILAAKANIKWVDGVLSVGVTVFGTIVLLKFLGANQVTLKGITINTSQAWIPALIFTVAHLYSTILLVGSLRSVWNHSSAEERRRLARETTATGGLFMRGLIARTKVLSKSGGPFIRYRMDIRDPSAWASQLALPILVLAVVPFSLTPWLLIFIPVAVLFAEANWTIGSHWAVALSELGSMKSKSTYFAEHTKGALCVVVLASQGGDYSFSAIPFPYVLIWLGLQAIGLAVRAPVQIAYMIYLLVRHLVQGFRG